MKKEFNRTDGMFSLCGLNCGLCPMQIRGDCSGCFNGSTCYQTCPIAPCSVRHGSVDYCYQCKEYPCKRYEDIDLHDSLISHRNQKKDFAKAKRIGIEAYLAEQRAKRKILDQLLSEYDDGRRDVFFCLAVNMMDVKDLQDILDRSEQETGGMMPQKKANHIEQLLHKCAKERGIPLILRR